MADQRRLVNVVIGPGLIGQAIARRVSAGKHVLLAPHQMTDPLHAYQFPSEVTRCV